MIKFSNSMILLCTIFELEIIRTTNRTFQINSMLFHNFTFTVKLKSTQNNFNFLNLKAKFHLYYGKNNQIKFSLILLKAIF